MLWIDHVMIGVRDLEAAARYLEAEFGLASYPGGRHTGRGTANIIVPLGRDYLELIAVVDAEEAARAPTGRWLQEVTAGGDRLASWCLASDEFDAVARRLDLTPSDWSRTRPDGMVLRWRLAAREAVIDNPALPFFIDWQVPPDLHPGRMPVAHRAQPHGIAWVEASGDRAEIRAWLGDAELPVRIVNGAPTLRAVAIDTAEGEIVLR